MKTPKSLEECQIRLASAKQKLDDWDARHTAPKPFDHGMLNVPLRVRNPRGIDALAVERAALVDEVTRWRSLLMGAENRAALPGRKARQEATREAADLKAQYGACAEVQWSENGRWYAVIRWSKKSATVEMIGGRESIPYHQVKGAR